MFKVGDVVQLKSGGLPMVVVNTSTIGAECQFYNEKRGEYDSIVIIHEALEEFK
ncbi:MAG: hypothetical protein [Caudoviricetes sp.]|nr:MAG: hypothetical protein [Caudoviricetes sp.]